MCLCVCVCVSELRRGAVAIPIQCFTIDYRHLFWREVKFTAVKCSWGCRQGALPPLRQEEEEEVGWVM